MGNKYTNAWHDYEIDLFFNNLLPNESWDSFRKRELPHRGLTAIRSKGRRLGINNNHHRARKYTFNKNIWKELTPKSCYYGAFIATDGCLVKYSDGHGYSLAIDLQESDSDFLERFKLFCSYTGFVRKSQVRTKNSTTRSLSIAIGQDWLEDLKNHYGIVPRKTHNLQPPY